MNVVTQFPAHHDWDGDLRYRLMFEGATTGIGICQLDGRMLEANPALSRMLGYSSEELTGARADEIFPGLRHSMDRGESSQEDQFLGELARDERQSFAIEKRYLRKDGSEFRGCLTVSLGRNRRRQPAFLIAMLADASDRRRVEEQLREAEQMEVIGRLAAGIAHDFNNLLTGILLYCDLLSSGLDEAGWTERNRALERSRLQQQVDEVRTAAGQGAALTRQLLTVARKQVAELRPMLINELVASAENLLRRLIGERIDLTVVLDSGVGPVLADPAQMRQVLMNLVLNARDAMPQGGKVWVITRTTEFRAAESRDQVPAARPGESHGAFPRDLISKPEAENSRAAVSLIVKDSGCGMDAETRARLFEPFFTTKDPETGTGLGLATVQRIVEELGGKITVESEQGRGTCIEVLFPAIEPSGVMPPSKKIPCPEPDSSHVFSASQGAP